MMKNKSFHSLLLTTLFAMMVILFTSCISSRTAQCGCPSKKSMVGY